MSSPSSAEPRRRSRCLGLHRVDRSPDGRRPGRAPRARSGSSPSRPVANGDAPGRAGRADLAGLADRPALGRRPDEGLVDARRPATTSTSSSSATGGVVSLRPGPGRAGRRQGRRDRQQGDARRRRPPRDAGGPAPGGRPAAATPRRPVREPARLAPPDRFGALGHLAVPRRRIAWRRSRRSS